VVLQSMVPCDRSDAGRRYGARLLATCLRPAKMFRPLSHRSGTGAKRLQGNDRYAPDIVVTRTTDGYAVAWGDQIRSMSSHLAMVSAVMFSLATAVPKDRPPQLYFENFTRTEAENVIATVHLTATNSASLPGIVNLAGASPELLPGPAEQDLGGGKGPPPNKPVTQAASPSGGDDNQPLIQKGGDGQLPSGGGLKERGVKERVAAAWKELQKRYDWRKASIKKLDELPIYIDARKNGGEWRQILKYLCRWRKQTRNPSHLKFMCTSGTNWQCCGHGLQWRNQSPKPYKGRICNGPQLGRQHAIILEIESSEDGHKGGGGHLGYVASRGGL
jgi:hypothetical protein